MKSVLLLAVVTVWLNVNSGSCAPSSCTLPPSKWCSSMDTAIQCGVLKHCLQSNFTSSHHRADPVEVGLYYESLCPGCRLFLTEMLFPTWLMLGPDMMTIKLVPYGNAEEKVVVKNYTYQCQHGPPECLGNMIETCLLSMSKEAFKIIYCMEDSSNVIDEAEKCTNIKDPALSWDKVMDCVKGDTGNKLMHENALATAALNPPHEYVPWVTINGKHSDDLQDKAMGALPQLVCDMYQGEKPAVCGGKQWRSKTFCHKE